MGKNHFIKRLMKKHGIPKDGIPWNTAQIYNCRTDIGTVKQTVPFIFINQIILEWHWQANTWDWNEFLDVVAAPSLRLRHGSRVLGVFSDNHSVGKFTYELEVREDTDASTKTNILAARGVFSDVNYDRLGMPVYRPDQNFEIDVLRDLSAVGIDIDIIAQGWIWGEL